MKNSIQQFHIKNLDQLSSDIKDLNLTMPISEDLSPLSDPLDIGETKTPNRLAVQPMEGYDAQSDGSPGALTFRRYMRYAAGGYGIIWIEATSVLQEARSNPAQLYLNHNNVESFKELVSAIRKTASDEFGHNIILILQLTHSGRFSKPEGTSTPFIVHHNPTLDVSLNIPNTYPLVTDDYIDDLQDAYLECAKLAKEAGFDGVDIKACHNDLAGELLAAFTREGKYGESFENRTRFLVETATSIKEQVPELLLATRMSGYDATPYPHGFGMDQKNEIKPDETEPIKLAILLKKSGVSLINLATNLPLIGTDIGASPNTPNRKTQEEHPLNTINSIINLTDEIQKAIPDIPVVIGDLSWLRQFIPNVASGIINNNSAQIIGLGRAALAYPDSARDIVEKGIMDPSLCCISCSACIQLLRDGGHTGCVIKDSEIYSNEYRQKRHFALDNLKSEAERCHNCESAACVQACPAAIDIPGFIKAFADDKLEESFQIIRKSNVLPEICAHLCPTLMMCEGACIETALSGNPIPIHDLQYLVSWFARANDQTGVSIPKKRSGKKIAIVGGGPTGTACSAKLIEYGHDVLLIERDEKLGGTPETVIPSNRHNGTEDEISALLKPAIDAGILTIEYNREISNTTQLDELMRDHDATVLATGLWQEISIGEAEGVIDAVTFLKKAKTGEINYVPPRVAILTGGDCAMDAAVTAKELGAKDLYLVYGGSLNDMHWHMPDDWTRNNDAQLLLLTDPIGYETDGSGHLVALKTCKTEYGEPNSEGLRIPEPIPDSAELLKVDMVIEAMGLGISNEMKNTLAELSFSKHGLIKPDQDGSFRAGSDKLFVAGGLINGGATVVQCVAEGMNAAEEINEFL